MDHVYGALARDEDARSTDAQTIDTALRNQRPPVVVVVHPQRSIVSCVSRRLRLCRCEDEDLLQVVGRTVGADVL